VDKLSDEVFFVTVVLSFMYMVYNINLSHL